MRSGRSGAEGSRTLDLLNAIQALSQLSYGPTTAGSAPGRPYSGLAWRGQRQRTRVAAGAREVAHRVDRCGADAHLVVEVRAGGAARLADGADRVPLTDLAADVGIDGGEVAVDRLQVEAVIDHHHVAVAVHPAGEHHGARAGRGDRRAGAGADVEPGMELPASVVG